MATRSEYIRTVNGNLKVYPSGRFDVTVEDRPAEGLGIVIGLEGLALGGCPINAIDLGKTLRTRGHRVEIFAIDERTDLSLLPVAERAGFDVTVMTADAGTVARATQMRRMMRRCHADIIHVFGPWLGPAASIAASGIRRRAAVVTNWTMDNVDYTPAGTTLIVGTRHLQREAEALHRGPVELQEPPVDLDADRPDPTAADAFRSQWRVPSTSIAAVIVSRFDTVLKSEGIIHAIRAIERLNDPRLMLLLVGDGSARDLVESEASRVNLGLGREAVVLTGAVHDPRPAYDSADIVLGMGGSALRALAHRKPLIVLGINGFAKTFEPSTIEYFYESGFYGTDTTPDPPSHLAGQLTPLLDPAKRNALGEFGLAEVTRRFGLDVGAQHLEAIYQRALIDRDPAALRMAHGLRTGIRTTLHELKKRLFRRLRRQQRIG